jgi:deoxyribodipyrimidine photo-lyase
MALIPPASISSHKPTVYALYVISPSEWKAHDVSAVKVDFILRNLACLSTTLWSRHQIPLIVKEASTAAQVHEIVHQFCEAHEIRSLFWNNEYEVNESRRDKRLRESLSAAKKSVKVFTYDDQVVVPPGELRAKSSGNVYTVYSPFKRAWFDLVRNNRFRYLTSLNVVDGFRNAIDESTGVQPSPVPAEVKGFELGSRGKLMRELYPAGEEAAQTRLNEFCASKALPEYEQRRNFPRLVDGTSGMSPYLAAGVVSAKQCVLCAIAANSNKLDSGSAGRCFYR